MFAREKHAIIIRQNMGVSDLAVIQPIVLKRLRKREKLY